MDHVPIATGGRRGARSGTTGNRRRRPRAAPRRPPQRHATPARSRWARCPLDPWRRPRRGRPASTKYPVIRTLDAVRDQFARLATGCGHDAQDRRSILLRPDHETPAVGRRRHVHESCLLDDFGFASGLQVARQQRAGSEAGTLRRVDVEDCPAVWRQIETREWPQRRRGVMGVACPVRTSTRTRLRPFPGSNADTTSALPSACPAKGKAQRLHSDDAQFALLAGARGADDDERGERTVLSLVAEVGEVAAVG